MYIMEDNSNMFSDDLEQLCLRLMEVPDILPTGLYFVFIESGKYYLCYVDSKYLPESITLFTSVCQHMTGIGSNMEIAGYGTIKWNLVYIKGHHKKFKEIYITCLVLLILYCDWQY